MRLINPIALWLSCLLPTALVAANKQPNILVILTDDQDLHLGSLDHMPNLQALLVQQGMTFNNHYCPVSLCCPARATLWTGRHAHNTNVTAVRNDVAGGAWKQVQRTGLYKDYLPVWLQAAGYNTYFSGKIFNGFGRHNYCKPHCAQGWTAGAFLTDPTMYRYYDSTFVSVNGSTWSKPRTVPGYSTDIISDHVKTYIDDAAASDKPFFAVAAPVACHVSGGYSYKDYGIGDNNTDFPYPIPKKEYRDLYPDIRIPRTSNFNPDNRTGVAAVWSLDQLTDANVDMLENYYRLRQQALKSVDDMVEELVAHLDSTGLLNNTYIIYTSDNGFHLGNHRLNPGKQQCFQEDVNVPFLIRGPDVAKGQSNDLITSHVDLTPTILQLAGASLDDHQLDGTAISFPLDTQADIARNQASRGDFAHLEFWGPFKQEGMEGDLGINYKVNLQTYKALRIQDGDKVNLLYSVWCQDSAYELYDMTWDPHQITNLHPYAPLDDKGSNAYLRGMNTFLGRPTWDVIYRLDAVVLVEKTCTGDACRFPWAQLQPGANITGLVQAINTEYDKYYHNSYSVARVGWAECYTGYSEKHSATLYSLENERPLWTDEKVVEAVRTGAAALPLAPSAFSALCVFWAVLFMMLGC